MAPGNRRRVQASTPETQIISTNSGSVAPAQKIEKKKRAITRGLKLDRLIKSSNGKLHVDFSSGKPEGPNVGMLSTEIGIVVRSHAPLNVDKWEDIPEEQTQPLIDRVLSKFDVDISRPQEAMMNYLENEDSENGSEPIYEAEICIKVLGNKSGYLKGLGITMPQKTSSSNFYSPKYVELKEKVEHQERLIQELQAQNTRMDAQNAKIMELMSKFTQSDVGLVNMNDDSP